MQGGGFLHMAGGAAQARAVDFWSSKSARGAQAQVGEGMSCALIYAVTPPAPDLHLSYHLAGARVPCEKDRFRFSDRNSQESSVS